MNEAAAGGRFRLMKTCRTRPVTRQRLAGISKWMREQLRVMAKADDGIDAGNSEQLFG
jgi:hypothetical protein